MKNLNTMMTKEEQNDFANDYDFVLPSKHNVRKVGELPEYVREAMKKAGVVRTIDGKFVKKSEISTCI